jgi:uncharacterized protein HemX
MLTKILITALVIVLAFAIGGARARQATVRRSTGQAPARTPSGSGPGSRFEAALPKLAAYGVIVILLLGVAGYLFMNWQDEHRELTVRVINTQSGQTTRYLVEKRALKGRSFETIDGRTVTLADTERMEVLAADE